MKKSRVLLPALAFVFAVVGAFASNELVQTKSYRDASNNCIAFTDCSASTGVSCVGLAIYNNITCSGTPVAGTTGNVLP